MLTWRKPQPPPPVDAEESHPRTEPVAQTKQLVIGPSLQIKGVLTVSEDVTIETAVDGTIRATTHKVTVGANARVTADIYAKIVVVVGTVVGSITAESRVEITPTGSVQGDVRAPSVVVADGSSFSGSINKNLNVTHVEATEPRYDWSGNGVEI